VFPCSTGERWKSWPKNQFDRARGKAKLEGGPHTLRHTFASHFLARQPDLGLLAEILGHSEEAVTRLYQHMLPERLARARNVVSIGMPRTNRMPANGRRRLLASAPRLDSVGTPA
jgi:integrase